MELSVLLGSVGVTLLLVAYFLSLFKIVPSDSILCSLLNIVGAFVACYASWMIRYIPFVVLEGVWGIVAVVGLVRTLQKRP